MSQSLKSLYLVGLKAFIARARRSLLIPLSPSFIGGLGALGLFKSRLITFSASICCQVFAIGGGNPHEGQRLFI